MTDIIDVDKSWDGKGSLDDHRHREFAKIQHPGFGRLPVQQPTAASEPPEDIPAKEVAVESDAEEAATIFTDDESD